MYDFEKKGYIEDCDLKRVAEEIVGIDLSPEERAEMLNLKYNSGQEDKVYMDRFMEIMRDNDMFF